MSFASHESATRQSAGDAITAEDIRAGGAKAPEDVARYALYLGDDALMLAQRLGWWIARAPELEEDIALANIALDLLGHARFLLTYAGTAWGKTEDDLAYFRDEEEFRSCRLVEQENGDFGQTIARQLIFSYYQYELYRRLVRSTDPTLAAIADKALKEVEYHQDHASQWILRLGLGTEESKRRVQAGLTYMWPYVDELFHDDELVESLGDVAVLPSSLRADFDRRITAILDEAGLSVPEVLGAWGGDRSGQFSEQRGHILAEMQVLARRHPGATW
ncbi:MULTISPECIES: 1,2-phenylacetyl-CoA epoxidase subunit PaaC [Kocuria]|uniref:Phenylacetate-CoA oxygenase n=1 Tax=Kocuria rosea subsp. polaris TaxID=136273 RepID=A0A0A6YC11_KOCRO|nr:MULTISPECIES: 1,2-phenylacetyl-CoA epoxidase subunit PaaC [Kocuria]NVC22844.1 phenylacetate-CoA oxygenase subunit PaaI [Kocuria salina]EYT52427.1 phenylacetate-CoA oxygenase [Kocuria sp. UCD-OTCP]KHD97127.1 phenylacetate-CoA oxygenase [Kocuria polaris]MCM3485736.1 phenylacetate-CoA oxygenase subunit PaaC [Kocuria rosea]PAU92365.1 phenylacetate-CoA oxygenase subunit PaaI [Kocuria sp. WN036]